MKAGWVILLACASVSAAVRADGTFNAVFVGAATDVSEIAVTENGKQISIPVTDPVVKGQIKDRFQPGDRLTIAVAGNAVQSIGPQTVHIGQMDRVLVLAGCLAVHLLFGVLLLGRDSSGW